eukprot:CAMPEP_0185768402 /NCGR_PEP_ID=MMETSP1174-20130828/49455_1 /TAXON_ID=35687 /ORGANISM="Dictyocha speculum, Strain CCMP1381" /LENGTH=65 /DNA_ID=CAMNT_0028453071 /DNA_START=26 /DNA_END=219 /DNA_ORIENTATION=-
MVPATSAKTGGNGWFKSFSAGIDANNELPKEPVLGPQGPGLHLDHRNLRPWAVDRIFVTTGGSKL